MHTKRVVHLIQSLGNGGRENVLLRTLPLLTQQGFTNIVITLKKEGEMAPLFKEQNIPVFCIKQRSIVDIMSYFRLVRLIKYHRPDILTTHMFHADMIGRLVVQPFAKIQVIPFLGTTYNNRRYRIARLCERVTRGLVGRYLANAKPVKDVYVQKLRVLPKKITVIPSGIDLQRYSSLSHSATLKRDLVIPIDHMIITCVANLMRSKGHRYLLEAFEHVYRKYPHITLLLAGDGPEERCLKKQIQHYTARNNIRFLGRRNDIPAILRITDIFVLPTFFEGMSNAIMEAMAAKKAIITTDLPENRELVSHGVSALLVRPRSGEEIEEVLTLLIQTPELRDRLANAAHERVEKDFDINVTVRTLAQFYQDALCNT